METKDTTTKKNNTMKKLIWIGAILVLLVFGAFKLNANKEEMKAEAALSEKVSEAIPVDLSTVEMGTLDEVFTASGSLEPVVDVTIVSETQGTITQLLHRKGDQVRKGDVLARVESGAQRAEVLAMKNQMDKASSDLARAMNMVKAGAMTEQQKEQADLSLRNAEAQLAAAEERLRHTAITAPVSGYVNDEMIQLGTYISPGMALFHIVDISTLKLNVKVPESHVLEMKEGTEVDITLRVLPTSALKGTITSVSQMADEALKYDTEIVLKNEKSSPVKAGMYAVATFNHTSEVSYLTVDRNALVGSVKAPQVYVVNDNIARLRDVRIGQMTTEKMVIEQGLEPGEQVVISGQINLVDSTRVRAISR
jgi:RND family efflux transporter MFP subunit